MPPESRTLLEVLRDRHILAVLTDGCLATQMRKVGALGLDTLVDTVIYTDTLGPGYWKPSRFFFDFLRETYGASRRYCYVGDNPEKDFRGARESSYGTVMLLNEADGAGRARVPDVCLPDVTIGALCELPDVLDDMFAPADCRRS